MGGDRAPHREMQILDGERYSPQRPAGGRFGLDHRGDGVQRRVTFGNSGQCGIQNLLLRHLTRADGLGQAHRIGFIQQIIQRHEPGPHPLTNTIR